MESILKKITEKILEVKSDTFKSFKPDKFKLHRESGKPKNVLDVIKNQFFLITEAKKGSPSKGIIRPDFNPLEIALAYEKGGASAISVITEENFFYGKPQNLKIVKNSVKIPVLRKDFIIHPYQIYQAYNLGADMVLLITACLDDNKLNEFYKLILSLGMTPLVEIHNYKELERVLKIKPKLIGINNRNLKSFKVDINTSFELKKNIPDNIFVISESGIKSKNDINLLKEYGFNGALIGESLLIQDDLENAVRELL